MAKEFLQYNTIRDNALELARRIHQDGFIPDVIYVSLRGGAYMGNVISEYFKMLPREGRPVFYAAVVARSYTDIRKQEGIMIDGWTYDPEYLRNGDKILFVDDIFDSGNTINHLVNVILKKGIPREDVKVAVHDFKIRTFHQARQPIHPDYYCRKHEIERPDQDTWIHYLSHELVGLQDKEIEEQYLRENPDLEKVFRELNYKK